MTRVLPHYYRAHAVKALEWILAEHKNPYKFVRDFVIRHPNLFKKITSETSYTNFIAELHYSETSAKSYAIKIISIFPKQSVHVHRDLIQNTKPNPSPTGTATGTGYWYYKGIEVPLTKEQFNRLVYSNLITNVKSDYFKQNKKILSIKLVRELTGLSLGDAKRIVDELYSMDYDYLH